MSSMNLGGKRGGCGCAGGGAERTRNATSWPFAGHSCRPFIPPPFLQSFLLRAHATTTMRLTLALLFTTATLAAAAADAGLAKGFVLSAPGASCSSTCESAGKKVAKFVEFNALNPYETAVCAVRASDKEGWVPGWQALNATGDGCHVALNLNATASATDVACLCLDVGEVQGLDLPAKGKPCSKACNKSITGRKGRPVAADAGRPEEPQKKAGYACISLPVELGVLNR